MDESGQWNKSHGECFCCRQNKEGEIAIDYAPNTNQDARVTWKPKLPSGYSMIAIFHTHPNAKGEKPSTTGQDGKNDVKTAKDSGVPVYVVSNRALYVYDPANGKEEKLRNNTEWQKSCKSKS